MNDQNNSRIHAGNTDEIEMDGKDKNEFRTRDTNAYKQKCPSWKENLSYYFSQYCGATSVHGVQYVGERGRLIIEKLVWTVVITIVWCICIFLITRTYNKWVTSPVIVTFATTETPISEIPFPAITISPEANSNVNIFNYTDVLIKKRLNIPTTHKEDEYFEIFSVHCEGLSDMLGDDEIQSKGNHIIERDRFHDLETAFPKDVMDKLPDVSWKGESFSYEDLVSVTYNGLGLAHTFNMLDYTELFTKVYGVHSELLTNGSKTNEWTLDKGYSKEDHRNTFPRRTFVSGLNGGFSFIDAANIDDSKYSCNVPLSGYKVTLHHPCELPNMDKHFRLPLGQAVFVAVKPRMITISENVKSYKPEYRKCYLTNERKLTFFRSYTQENCEHECRLNATLNHCHCLPFYMFIYDDVPLCGPASMTCVESIQENYTSKNDDECNCLPSCTSLEYDVEITQTGGDFNFYLTLAKKLQMKNLSLPVDYSNFSFSFLVVYYKEMQFLASERNELYGYVDFFSNTGGLLGLFIGVSVTSLIEILYFLTLRLGCNIKMFGKRFWSGAPELINNENVK